MTTNGGRQPAVIYAITFAGTHKKYVGASTSFIRRQHDHLQLLRQGCHPETLLQETFDGFGEQAMSFVVVDEWVPEFAEEISEQELLRMTQLIEKRGREYLLNLHVSSNAQAFKAFPCRDPQNIEARREEERKRRQTAREMSMW